MAAALRDGGHQAFFLRTDVTRPAEVRALIGATVERHWQGRTVLDILVVPEADRPEHPAGGGLLEAVGDVGDAEVSGEALGEGVGGFVGGAVGFVAGRGATWISIGR